MDSSAPIPKYQLEPGALCYYDSVAGPVAMEVLRLCSDRPDMVEARVTEATVGYQKHYSRVFPVSRVFPRGAYNRKKQTILPYEWAR